LATSSIQSLKHRDGGNRSIPPALLGSRNRSVLEVYIIHFLFSRRYWTPFLSRATSRRRVGGGELRNWPTAHEHKRTLTKRRYAHNRYT